MSHIEYGGKTYCDWRIAIENCEGSDYFFVIYAFGVAIGCFCLPCLLVTFAIRKYGFGESLGLFPTRENGMALLLFVINLFVTFQFLSVLVNWPDLLSGVLWAFSYPTINITMCYHMALLWKAFPKTIMTQSNWGLSDRAFSQLSFLFATFLIVTHVVMISTSWSLSLSGEVSIGNRLQRAGLIITSINCLVLVSGLAYSCLVLKRMIQNVLQKTLELSHKDAHHTLLAQTSDKLQQHFTTIIILGTLQLFYFSLLAFYPGFFTNIYFSKALATIMVSIHHFNGTLNCFFAMVFDIKRYIHEKRMKENSSRGTERKEEIPQEKLSVAVEKDQIEHRIEDLKANDSSQE